MRSLGNRILFVGAGIAIGTPPIKNKVVLRRDSIDQHKTVRDRTALSSSPWIGAFSSLTTPSELL